MNYINHKLNGFIETVEDIRLLSKADKLALIKEYQLVSSNYYTSLRASKDFYANNKKGDK